MNRQINVTHVLPAIHVPTLLIAKAEDVEFPIARMRWLTEQIVAARIVELPGDEHFFWVGEYDSMLSEIERFVDALSHAEAELERFLATVLFTDIVGSTETGVRMGDRAGKTSSKSITHGSEGNSPASADARSTRPATGSSRPSTDPAEAVRCAQAIVESVRSLGIEVRAGLHTGECEEIDGKVGGIAVNIGARVAAVAGASEVFASQTVKDLTAGSGLAFEDTGEHELKGVPDRWRLYRVLTRSIDT